MSKFQLIIGRSEKIDLINIINGVPAKIDTGAFRSAIHCKSAKVVKRGDKKVLIAELLGHPCAPETRVVEFDNFEEVSVSNSFGHEEKRYEVRLRVKLGPKVITSSFTLANRVNNLFPILIGRKVLKNRFIVDVAHASVDRMKLKKQFGVKTPIDSEDLED